MNYLQKHNFIDHFTSIVCRKISSFLTKNFWYPDGDFDPFIDIYPIKYFSFFLLTLVLIIVYIANY